MITNNNIMENNINNPEIINDIIKINNDRIEGYKKAIDLATSHGLDRLIPTFQKFIGQSEEFIAELTPYVELEGKEPTDSTMLSGKLFRAWMGIKVNITGDDERSLLETCEQGEDAFKSTYQTALADGSEELSQNVHSLINTQLSKQLEAHNIIKMLRDSKTI
ncbi:MAG: PA2169 family four-helix-bundle protein [Sphingobacterium sp.]